MVSVSQAIRLLAEGRQNKEPQPPSQGIRLAYNRSEWLPKSTAEMYQQLLEYMISVGKKVDLGQDFAPHQGARLMRKLLDYPPDFLRELHIYALSTNVNTNDLARHGLHVSINATLLARAMNFNRRQQLELAIAALFHELGMYKLPKTLRDKNEALSIEEQRLLHQHPLLGASMLMQCGKSWNRIAKIISQEHERTNGSGYPHRLKGEEILVSSSIIGILDLYEALINDRPHRKRLAPDKAALIVLKDGKNLFPPAVIKQFLNLFSIYPVNSYVQLNNGAIGIVSRANPLAPMKPEIKVLYDAQGRIPAKGKHPVDLSKFSLLYIQKVLREEDMAMPPGLKR